MKSILFIAGCAVVLCGVFAADEVTLLKQGKQLVATTEKAIEDYHKQGKEHLLLAVEWQLNLVQTLIGMLENDGMMDFGDIMTPGQLAIVDSHLQYAENRLAEELAIVRDYVAHAKHDNGTVADLVAHAKALQAKTLTALKSDLSTEHTSVHNDINYEMRSIQSVIASIEGKPNGTDLRKEIEMLERNEISLNGLLRRIGANSAFY